MNKKFWATTFTLTGTIIGAGILGLPYVFSKSGLFIGVFWVLILGLIVLITNLYLGEVCLSTKSDYQLTGYAEKYFGSLGKKILAFGMIFGIYSALIAYLIGEGQSLSLIITGSNSYAIVFAFIFWIVITALQKKGIERLRIIETWGVIAIILLIIFIFVYFAPQINTENYKIHNFDNFFMPIGVIMFALLGFTSIPELKKEIKGQEKKLKRAIIIGSLIPILLYIIFSLTFLGVLGEKVPEVSTLGFGRPIVLLGIFTMMTSYFVLSFSIKNMYQHDFNLSNTSTFFLSSVFPFLLYFIITKFNLLGFASIIGIGGVVSGGVIGIMILLMNKKSKQKSSKKPEYTIPINWIIIAFFYIIFMLCILAELYYSFKA